MSRKKLYNSGGIVYSTAKDFNSQNDEEDEAFLLPAEQNLKIVLDKKNRAGKAVSIVKGFVLKDEDIEDLSKKLKSFCGTGGSVKEKEIIIQGDQREKILQWLLKNGYSKSRKI